MTSQDKTLTTNKAVAASAGIIALGTFVSRILGFIRDMILAKFFGATPAADAFYVAFRIPNMLRELFAEGSMSAGFIPVFTEYLKKRSRAEAKALANTTFTLLFFGLSILVSIGILLAPAIVTLIAPGFARNPLQFQLTTTLTQIMFPFLLFVSMAALAMGILNSAHRFGPPSMASGIFNLVSIIFFIVVAPLFSEPVYGAALGVAIGGIAQWAIQLPALYKEGFPPSFQCSWPLHPGIVKIWKLILPVSLGLSVTQINLLVNTLIASYLPTGSVSFLYYGMRLIQFPLGVFAVALATAILPTLSAQAAQKETEALRQTFSFGLRMVFFITFPAMIGLIFLRVPIVHLLFEHGEFTAIATQGTADAIFCYAIGLPAFAGIRIVASVFYSLQDTKTPVKIGLISILINLLLNLLLMKPLGHRGLALATALSAIFNFLALLFILKTSLGGMEINKMLRSTLQVIVASCVMITPAFWVVRQEIWMRGGHWETKGVLLFSTLLASVLIYSLIQAKLKSEEFFFLYGMLKEKVKRSR